MMIDTHCHLEQKDYDKDRDKLIGKCRQELDAVITSCAHPNDFEKTLEICEKHKEFVFCTVGLHPEFIKDLPEEKEGELVEKIKKNKSQIVGIGEVGLDYNWVREEKWKPPQREQFKRFIKLAKSLDLPLVIHSRDAYDETLQILEDERAKRVQLHMFGAPHLFNKILKNGWIVSVNTIVLKSKKHKSLVKKLPIENIMLETDAPWLSPKQLLHGQKERNTPLSVAVVAEKIAEIKSIPLEEVDKVTTENAKKFFGLKL
jgi:TatD DNase family protein